MDDPPELPGLAHFCEHMLFLGTDKYPDPLGFTRFLAASTGSYNAYTSAEETVYYADFTSNVFAEAVDRLADFFRAPLFNREFVKKEVHAIDSEHQKNLQDPTRHFVQVLHDMSNPKSRFNSFSTGNYQTLYEDAHKKGLDPVESLNNYFKKRYCPQQMRLVTVGPQDLQEQLSIATQRFGALERRDDESCLTRNFSLPPAWPPERLSKWVVVEGREPQTKLWLYFPMPDLQQAFLSKPLVYINYLFTYKGEKSLHEVLNHELGLVSDVKASSDSTTAGTGLYIYFTLTRKGSEHLKGLLDVFFSYVATLKHTGVDKALYQSLADTLHLQFNWTQPSSPTDTVKDYAERMLRLPPSKLISGDTRIDELRPELVQMILERLSPANMIGTYVPPAGETTFPEGVEVRTVQYYGVKYASQPLQQAFPGATPHWTAWLSAKPESTELQQKLRSQGLVLRSMPRAPGQIQDVPANLATDHMAASHGDSQSFLDTGGELLYGPRPRVLPGRADNSTSTGRLVAEKINVWYRSGWKTMSPTVSLSVELRPYMMALEPEPSVLDQLRLAMFGRLLNKVLTPKLADLTVTGQTVKVNVGRSGVSFTLTGFEPVLPQIIDKVIAEFNTFILNESAAETSDFNQTLEEVREQLSSYQKLPAQYAVKDKQVLLTRSSLSQGEELAELDKLHPSSVMTSVRELLFSKPLAVDALVMGNIGEAVADTAVRKFATGLALPRETPRRKSPLPGSKVGDYDPIAKPSKPVEVRKRNPRDGDPNDVAHISILHGVATIESRAVYGIMQTLLQSSLYTHLRTEEQLGYIVTGGFGVMSNVHYAAGIVQGNVRSADEMEVAIESVFFDVFPKRLMSLTEQEFESQRRSFIGSMLQPPASTKDETNHFAGAVSHGGVCFDLLDEVIQYANSSAFTKDLLVQSWSKLMTGPRKKVSVKYFAGKVPVRSAATIKAVGAKRNLTQSRISQLLQEYEQTLVLDRADSSARETVTRADANEESYYPTDLFCGLEHVAAVPVGGRANGFLQRHLQ
eukprot:TRINITY_DN33244_c0_g1_i1.p1 TRINITY_DN33244_c0_g1~~TRINITY_DN33244_c0_g1_i1.p1  ORF type:complete len:1124 (-),score=201.72 TRINITY_DN33244_c0_g1_i1:94-3177(-)